MPVPSLVAALYLLHSWYFLRSTVLGEQDVWVTALLLWSATDMRKCTDMLSTACLNILVLLLKESTGGEGTTAALSLS